MKKWFSNVMNWIAAIVVVALMVACVFAPRQAAAGETKYASGTTSAAVTFGPQTGLMTLKSIYATTDKTNATCKLYAWNKVAAVAPSTAPAATNVIALSNTGYTYTNSDTCVYVHADGTAEYRTISSATTSNVTINTAISQAGSTSDKLYEVTQAAQFDFDVSGAGVGTNKYGKFEGTVFVGLGPIYIVQDGTSNAVINATVE